MLTDYSVLISESYDGQHKLLTEELKRKGTKVHICGDTEIELEIGAVKYTPDVIVIDCCKLGYKKLLHFREILHENDIYPIIYITSTLMMTQKRSVFFSIMMIFCIYLCHTTLRTYATICLTS